MNYLVQRGKVRGQVINVPDGLPELLSDITREVLRCQPTTECLCQFIIDYLHSIIVTRQKARIAKSIIDMALKTVDEIIEDLCICSLDLDKAEEVRIQMEECFKRFLEKRRCEARTEREIVKFHEEDMLDELISRCKFTPDELKITRPAIEAAYNRFVAAYMAASEGTEGTEALYQYFKNRELKRIEDELRNRAATVIQSNFRGYMVRRTLFSKDMGEEKPFIDELFDWDPDRMEEYDAAARKIQMFFRKIHASEMEAQAEEEDGSVCTPKTLPTDEADNLPPEISEALRPEPPAAIEDLIPENIEKLPAIASELDLKGAEETAAKPDEEAEAAAAAVPPPAPQPAAEPEPEAEDVEEPPAPPPPPPPAEEETAAPAAEEPAPAAEEPPATTEAPPEEAAPAEEAPAETTDAPPAE